MLKKDKKTKIIYTDSDIKVSRFLLDLPAKFSEEDDDLSSEDNEKILSKIKNKAKKLKFSRIDNSLLEKISTSLKKKRKQKKPEIVFSDYKLPELENNFFQSLDKNIESKIHNPENNKIKGEKKEKSKSNNKNKHYYKIERLAFFPLFKILYFLIRKIVISISRISHGIGWITVFLFKFTFILFYRVLNFFLKGFLKNILSFKRQKKKEIIKVRKKNLNLFRKISFKKDKKTKINFSLDSEELIAYEEGKEIGSKKEKIKRQDERFGLYKKIIHFILNKNKVKKQKSKVDFKFRKLAFRPAFGFFMILVIFALPFKAFTYYKDLNLLKGRVLEASENAVSGMMDASRGIQSKDFNEAEFEFRNAENNFSKARDEVKNLSLFFGILENLIPSKKIKLAAEAENILEAGSLSARIGIDLNNLFSDFDSKNLKTEEIIISLSTKVDNIEKNISRLNLIINDIDSDIIPEEYSLSFKSIQEKFIFLSGTISEFSNLLESLKIFSGFYDDERYLLVFQNNTEMRASGGFIGSYALADLRNGEIINLEVPKGGSYDTDGGLYEKIIAPKPLHLVNPLWHFWDANWWPDWTMSAEKLMWFYEKSGGPSVDGVISFTPTVLEKMLEVIGPIDMGDEYGVVINADNFWEITQKIVEEKPTTLKASTSSEQIKHEPKKIIGDMMQKVLIRFKEGLNKEEFLSLVKSFTDSLDEKQLMFYFKDPELKKQAKFYACDGEIKDTSRDYLMVVNSNIAGAKSDKSIKEEIIHKSEIQGDGSIINTVKIKRTHTAVRGTEFTGVRNVDWMRIYVPLGSKLISFEGAKQPDKYYFEDPEDNWKEDRDVLRTEGKALTHPESGTKIYEEKNKTVFANWCMVDPGESIEIIVKYKLPFKMEANDSEDNFRTKIEKYFNPHIKDIIPYSLLVQKQPGSLGSKFSSELILTKDMQAVWAYPRNLELKYNGWDLNDILLTDKYYAIATSLK